MGLFSSQSNFPWEKLESSERLMELLNSDQTILLFKHSTRCPISSMALRQFEKEWNQDAAAKLVYLDLIAFRSISNQIEAELKVIHQSPQAIVVRNKEVLYHESHESISAKEILQVI